MVISHNLLAMNAQRQFNITGTQKKKSTEKLASGYRINRAADDAAGLAISEKMRRQIRGLNQASRNIQDGISLVQVADGALNEDHAILQRINELAVQAANDTNSQSDRQYIQDEINQLVTEVDRVANTTSFNEKIFPLKRATGTMTSSAAEAAKLPDSGIAYWNLPFQTIDLSQLSDGNYGDYTISNGGRSVAVNGSGNYKLENTGNSTDITINSNAKIVVEGNANKITVSQGKGAVLLLPSNPATSGIMSVDMADNSSLTIAFSDNSPVSNHQNTIRNMNMGNDSTLNVCANLEIDELNQNSSASNRTVNLYNDAIGRFGSVTGGYFRCDEMNFMGVGSVTIGPGVHSKEEIPFTVNELSGLVSKVTAIRGLNADYIDLTAVLSSGGNSGSDNRDHDGIWIQAGAEAYQGITINTVDARKIALGLTNLSVMSSENAGKTIEKVKTALDKVSEYRSYFGAMQNRLEHAMANDDNIAENTQYAESRIRDTDMAKEMVANSIHNILEQAGTTMIAQANQINQGVLNLLQ